MVDFNSEQFVFILVVILDLEIGQFLFIGIEYDGDIVGIGDENQVNEKCF